MKNTKIIGCIVLAMATTSCQTLQQKKEKSALAFDIDKYELQTLTQDGKTFQVRAYENIAYVENPVDTTYQKMNIYIPAEYFEGKSIDGFTAQTAPIFFPNQVGGYMPAKAGTAKKESKTPPTGERAESNPLSMAENERPARGNMPEKVNTIAVALSKGYVVASAGARGRTNANGKAPAVIVDLKAAVRYLKFNDQNMPGDAQKIVSNGTSAGGAVSALLGATGDSKDYEPYLKQLGAAQASDAIFAVSAYCPITNLDNADMAYEWQFQKVIDYKKIDISMLDYKVERKEVAGKLDDAQQKVSSDLAKLFPAYLNGLNLKDRNGQTLTLDENGNGSFKDLVKKYVIASAQKAQKEGKDMRVYAFLKVENGTITDLDFDAYVAYMERQKTPPAFDALDLSSGENQEFGDETTDKKHFTQYALKNSTVQGAMADSQIVRMMNPMYYIGKENVATSKHWRIRHGSKDKDTGLAVSVILTTLLENHGYTVDFALPWDKPHSGDYDLEELFAWIKQVTK
ncbi:subtype B tannase [Bergeyella porcorum]|uniref:subtype B tannase n=1 Tax=Bergeyella porcorum TaxID=1735111 RepID=UPI0035F027B3